MRRKYLPLFLGLAFVLSLSFYLFEEFYYYRDRQAWISPLPSTKNIAIRRDRLGKGDFGAKRNGGRHHQGVDLLAEVGTPVVAVRSGRARIGNVPRGMGKFVTVTHRDGTKSLYGHLSEIYVSDHSRVRQGQLIGSVGKTGNASSKAISPHLHFEIRQGKKFLNPTPFLIAILSESS
ncbi:MAG: M23 family metallopeptidase [Candidatus Omnitrophica bacterium]|nr:M23 family metallopeptidase [Candidatus Omnitrophota bacterium]